MITEKDRIEQAIGRIYSVVNAIEEVFNTHNCSGGLCKWCQLNNAMQNNWENWLKQNPHLPAAKTYPSLFNTGEVKL